MINKQYEHFAAIGRIHSFRTKRLKTRGVQLNNEGVVPSLGTINIGNMPEKGKSITIQFSFISKIPDINECILNIAQTLELDLDSSGNLQFYSNDGPLFSYAITDNTLYNIVLEIKGAIWAGSYILYPTINEETLSNVTGSYGGSGSKNLAFCTFGMSATKNYSGPVSLLRTFSGSIDNKGELYNNGDPLKYIIKSDNPIKSILSLEYLPCNILSDKWLNTADRNFNNINEAVLFENTTENSIIYGSNVSLIY